MRVTAGVYPIASPTEVASLFPEGNHSGDWVLAMDWAGIHELKSLRPHLFAVGRRHQSDPQVDFRISPEAEADRWFSFLAASGMGESLDAWVGPNEYFGSRDLDDTVWAGLRRGHWVARFESRLGRRVYFELHKRYWWGSVGVGNIEPSQYAAYFRDKLNPTVAPWLEGPAYHAYCPPHRTSAESPGDANYPFYVYRPWWWKQAGGQWRTCLISESGTYYSWKNDPRETPGQYANTLKTIAAALERMRAAGVPVSPPAVFGFGVDGDLGRGWNVDGTSFTSTIAQYNSSLPIVRIGTPVPIFRYSTELPGVRK